MRKYFTLAALFFAFTAAAQDYRAKPLTCRDILRNAPPLPHVLAAVRMCERTDAYTAQQIARIYGRPMPSQDVWTLPAHGSTLAKQLGYACLSGLAMKRLKNGWEQVRNANFQYQRCLDA